MTTLLALAALGQIVWPVFDLDDTVLGDRNLGRYAAGVVSAELSTSPWGRPLWGEDLEVEARKLGESALVKDDAEALVVGMRIAPTIVFSGQIGVRRVQAGRGGRRATVVLRLVGTDCRTGRPAGGAVVMGISPPRKDDVSEEALVREAVADASRRAVAAYWKQIKVAGPVVETRTRNGWVKGGARLGFRPGMDAFLSRGGILSGYARIGEVGSDRAEFTPTGTIISLAPGDILRPIWSIEPLPFASGGMAVDPQGDDSFGKQEAIKAIQARLTMASPWSLAPLADVRRARAALDDTMPKIGMIGAIRVGSALRAEQVMVCDEPRIESLDAKGRGKARVTVRTIVYDVASGLSFNGAWECAEAANAALPHLAQQEALRRAVAKSVERMKRLRLPSAKVRATTARNIILDRGERAGFRIGDAVAFFRGHFQINMGCIVQVDRDSALAIVERQTLSIAPGDRAVRPFDPMSMPDPTVGARP